MSLKVMLLTTLQPMEPMVAPAPLMLILSKSMFSEGDS